ncbi:MAG: DUF1992 domain-containing protein [Nocardioides sp.]|nr:DUF1992 domain-containing protein [Nocardioides sp.]
MGDGSERLDRSPERDERTGRAAASERIRRQHEWVDLQVKQAMDRGDFDDLPGFGKPIADLGHDHDPDWWVKQLIEREQITGVLPPALQLRKEDAELDGRLDTLATAEAVAREVEDFNARVRKALYSDPGGPPVITAQRDVERQVAAWQERRTARIVAQRAALERTRAEQVPRQRRWWQRPGRGPKDP